MKVTKEQIEAWKNQHGEISVITVDSDKKCYLKTPSRKAMSYATIVGKTDPVKKMEVLLNDAWLGGDDEIKTDDSLFYSVIPYLDGLINIKEATLEKL